MGKLTADEKELIELMFKSETSICQIAKELERSVSTISSYLESVGLREIKPKSANAEQKAEKPTSFDAHRFLPVNEEPKKEKPRNLHINRGEIYYIKKRVGATLEQQEAGRPGIIVSNNKCNLFSDFVEVVYLTTQEKAKDLPTHATILSTGKKSTALCEKIQTIPKTSIAEYVGACTDEEIEAVNKALVDSIGLNFFCQPITESESQVIVEDNNAELEKANAEKDMYKKLYEDLLERIIKNR